MSDLYIDTPAALADLCRRLRGSQWLALDTEFIREKTYYSRLCLLQIANEDVIGCVDVLVLQDLGPLLDILYDPSVTKVLHSATQDLEIFYHLRAAVPGPIFDTQIAATLLGWGDQVGYATLVKGLLDIELDKSQTRTDWSQRPLAPAQLEYAADDVRYLRDVYRQQREALERCQRLAWLSEDFAALSDAAGYRVQAQDAWTRIKGKQHLRGVQVAVLQALAAWREQRAAAIDRPRRWLVGDDALITIARQMPTKLEQLQRIRGLEARFLKSHGPKLLQLIAAARAQPREQWPELPPRRQLSAEQEALVDAMMAVVRLRGAQQSVNATMLAARKDLENLLAGDTDVALLRGWRAAVAGQDVMALLQGELRLEVHAGGLRAAAMGD